MTKKQGKYLALLLLGMAANFLAIDAAAAQNIPDGFNCFLCVNSQFKECILETKTSNVTQVQNELESVLQVGKIACNAQPLSDQACTVVGDNASSLCAGAPKYLKDIGATASAATDGSTGSSFDFKLGVPIPGFQTQKNLEVKDGYILIPYLAQYIQAFQKYLFGIALIAAAVMIIYGGFLYIASQSGAKVRDAKKIIYDAILGMVIVLCAYLILYNINPRTVEPSTLSVKQVNTIQFSYDKEAVRREVEQAAMSSSEDEIPLVLTGGTDANGNAITENITNASPSNIVRDANGLPVAQGNCPPGMVMIKYSEAYTQKTKKNVKAFCMDKYEAPNIPGTKPFIGVADPEADWWCNERGKRLCTLDEWQRACLGPDGTQTYMYGTEYIEGQHYYRDTGPKAVMKTNLSNAPAPCNYDSDHDGSVYQTKELINAYEGLPVNFTAALSVLNPDNPKLSDPKYKAKYDAWKSAIEKWAMQEPSGKRPGCISQEGVVDLLANTQEIVLSPTGATKSIDERMAISKSNPTGAQKPYNWAGFYWSPLHHLGEGGSSIGSKPTCLTTSGSVHPPGYRTHENGFRCCVSLDP